MKTNGNIPLFPTLIGMPKHSFDLNMEKILRERNFEN